MRLFLSSHLSQSHSGFWQRNGGFMLITDDKIKQVHACLKASLKNMLQVFMLTHYNIRVIYEENLETQMEMWVDHEYLEGKIYFGKRIVELFFQNADAVIEVLCHEVTHVFTTMLTDEWKGKKNGKLHKRQTKLEEQVTEHLSRILMFAYQRRDCVIHHD